MKKYSEQMEKEARAERLKTARKAAGFSSGERAANRFHWNPNSYKAHESGRNGFGQSDAKQYATAFRVSLAWLQTGEGPLPEVNISSDELTQSSAPINMIPVTGRVAASNWLSVDDMDFSYNDIDYVPSVGNYPIDWQFALVVEGNCLNKVASHGDRLVCINTIAASIDIKENDLAIIERTRFGGQMVERTAKRVRRSAKGFELWPESLDPDHQEPMLLYDVPEGETIEVIGKVLWILKTP